MDQDDFVVISHSDIPPDRRVCAAGTDHAPALQLPAAGHCPRPYTRAWIDLMHSLDANKWSSNFSSGCGGRSSSSSSSSSKSPHPDRSLSQPHHSPPDRSKDMLDRQRNNTVPPCCSMLEKRGGALSDASSGHSSSSSSSSSSSLPPPASSYLDEISAYVDGLADALWPVNKTIHDNPELGFAEAIAHRVLTAFLDAQPGWKVSRSVYGLATAWIAVYDSGTKGPVVSFNVEMDALVGIGHACGHNLIATASLAAGLAAARTMHVHHLAGKVVLFGTPAEEGGGGKIKLLEAGAYRDHHVDVSLIHPGTVADCAAMRTSAYTRLRIEYFGRAAHAAASPWLGINALDALVTAYNALSVLRQQTMPGDIIQGHITHGGAAPNIIHAYAAGVFVVRADTRARLRALRAQVDACFGAGAAATGARLVVTEDMAYADHVPNRVLARGYTRFWNALVPDRGKPGEEPPPSRIPLDQDRDEARGASRASTDQGDVSYAMPSLHVGFSIVPGPEGQGPHNPEFASAAGTRDAFARCLRVAKALAGTALEVLTQKGLVEEVKEAWKDDMKRYGQSG